MANINNTGIINITFSYIYFDGMIILFQTNDKTKSSCVNKMIYIKNENLYETKSDSNNLVITIQSKFERKNILIFKNKMKYIKYKKYNKILLKFESVESFEEVK